METKNYDWKNIVFEIRDIVKKDGYKEEYPISDVFDGTYFCFYNFKTESSKPYTTTINGIIFVDAIPKKINKYDETYKFGIIEFTDEPIDEDITEIIIDAGTKMIKDRKIIIDKLERLHKIYIENSISIRFVISLIHEIGHSFENLELNVNFPEEYFEKGLSSRERDHIYHSIPNETFADMIACKTLYHHGEEILKIILNNKK